MECWLVPKAARCGWYGHESWLVTLCWVGDGLVNCPTILYSSGMRRNARSITTSPEIVRHIDGLTEANFKLLTELIPWLDANKKTERKFRIAVIHELTRIESAISLLLVGQEAQSQWMLRQYGYDADKLDESAKWAEEVISKRSESAGMETIRYIYREDPVPEPRHDRRRKWWGWEI